MVRSIKKICLPSQGSDLRDRCGGDIVPVPSPSSSNNGHGNDNRKASTGSLAGPVDDGATAKSPYKTDGPQKADEDFPVTGGRFVILVGLSEDTGQRERLEEPESSTRSRAQRVTGKAKIRYPGRLRLLGGADSPRGEDLHSDMETSDEGRRGKKRDLAPKVPRSGLQGGMRTTIWSSYLEHPLAPRDGVHSRPWRLGIRRRPKPFRRGGKDPAAPTPRALPNVR